MKGIIGILTVTAEEEQPLIVELWHYFYDTYFNPSEYYENLDLTSSDVFSIRIIILGLCIGIVLALFGAVFNKRVLGDVVRRLLKKEALSPESALTLEELGYENKPLIRLAVKKSTSLRRVVKCREELEYDADQEKKRKEYEQKRAENNKLGRFKEIPYKMNTYADAFFIPEDMKYMADIKFEKKGTTWLGAVVFSIMTVVAFVVIIVALPSILSLINDFAGSFASSTPDNIV